MTQARFQTMRHIETVRNYLTACITELLQRQMMHDQSKLAYPEVEAFEVLTASLRGLTYGSVEYRQALKAYAPAIQSHYSANRHHPEHFRAGIQGMTLLDLVEMLCDWKAATLRHDDGDIRKSLEINQQRFGYGDELKTILGNTILWLEAQHVMHFANES